MAAREEFRPLGIGGPFAVGLLAFVALTGGSSSPAPPAVAPPAATPAPQPTTTRSSDPDLAGVLPVVRLIADAAGVKLPSHDTIQAWWVVSSAQQPGSRHIADAIASLGEELARTEGTTVAPTRGKSTSVPIDTAVSALAVWAPQAGSRAAAARDTLLQHFGTPGLSKAVIKTTRARVGQQADVDFIIATLPDYVNSLTRWNADEILATIQAASGAAEYQLDGYILPGTDASDKASPAATDQHPGALVMKRLAGVGGSSRMTLQVFLLVGETATAGIQKAAFKEALQLVDLWRPGERIRILGPSFSGAVPPMRLVLDEFAQGHDGKLDVEVTTASATSPENSDRLGVDNARLNVAWASTVHTDKDYLDALERQIREMGITPCEVALLSEETTAWGQSVLQKRPRANAPDFENASKQEREHCAPHNARPLHLAFPLHVSRLETASAARRPQLPWSARAGSDEPLRLDDSDRAVDRLPSFTPQLTEAVLRASLRSILGTLEREQVKAVGVFATDKRDFIFLAREVNRAAPNVLLFTTEPHVLFLDPNYRAFVRGTLVASSYPLYSHTQALFSTDGTRRQFASMGSQGLFNAVMHLLGKAGCADCLAPARPVGVWLSVVGQDRFMPLNVSALTGTLPEVKPDYLRTGAFWKVTRVGTVLFLMLHLVAMVVARRREVPGFRVFSPGAVSSGRRMRPGEFQEYNLLVLAAATALLSLLCWLATLANTIVRDLNGPAAASWGVAYGAAAAAVAASLGLAALVQRRVWVTQRTQSLLSSASLAVTGVLAVGSCVFVVFFAVRSPMLSRKLTLEALFAAERSLDIPSLLSPAVMVIAISAIGYAWSVWSLRCLRNHVFAYSDNPSLLNLLTNGEPHLANRLASGLASTIHRSSGFAALSLLTAALGVIAGLQVTASIDGRLFAWLIVCGSTLALVLVTTEAGQAAWLGYCLKQVLQNLQAHPISSPLAERAKDPIDWSISVESKFATARDLLAAQLDDLSRRFTVSVSLPSIPLVTVSQERRAGSARQQAPPSLPSASKGMASPDGVRIEDLACVAERMASLKQNGDVVSGVRPALANSECDLPLMRTRLWAVAVDVADRLVPVLQRRMWFGEVDRSKLTGGLQSVETLVSLVVALVIRSLAVRVVRGLGIAVALATVLFVAHTFYTFPGRHFWLGFDLAVLTTVAVLSVLVLLTLERDVVLSRLWSTNPGGLGLKSGLVARAAVSVSLPLLTMFAVYFPEAGGGLMDWVEPLRRSMPALW